MSNEMEEYIKKENIYNKMMKDMGVLSYDAFNTIINDTFNKSKYSVLNETNVKLLEEDMNRNLNSHSHMQLYKVHIFIDFDSHTSRVILLPANQETYTLMSRGGISFKK